MTIDPNAIAREFAEGALTLHGVYMTSLRAGVDYPGHTREAPTTYSGFLFALRGKATFTFEDTLYTLIPGKIVHGAAGMTLKPQVEGSADFEYALIHYGLAATAGGTAAGGGAYADRHFMLSFENCPDMPERLQRLHQSWSTPGGIASLRTKELFYGLLSETLSGVCKSLRRESRGEIDGIIEYMHRHYMETHTLGTLAERCGMDAKRFAYLFSKSMGLFPIDYLIRHRMLRARQMLAFGDLSVTQVAESVGYADAHYFSRLFKKYEGCSPREFRRRLGNRPSLFR